MSNNVLWIGNPGPGTTLWVKLYDALETCWTSNRPQRDRDTRQTHSKRIFSINHCGQLITYESDLKVLLRGSLCCANMCCSLQRGFGDLAQLITGETGEPREHDTHTRTIFSKRTRNTRKIENQKKLKTSESVVVSEFAGMG